jgi:M6 family metalloprotease-like protein
VRRLPLALLALALTAASSPAGVLAVRPVAATSTARPALSASRRSVTPTEAQAREQHLRRSRWLSFPDVLAPPGMPLGASKPHARRTSAGTPRLSIHGAASTPDTIRVALLRIDFRTDRGGSLSTGDGHFDLSGPDTLALPIDPPPHNRAFWLSHVQALNRYYSAQSFGQVVVVGDVWPRTPNGAYSVSDMADFGPWTFGTGIYAAAVHLFRTMLFAADSQSVALGDRIPWDRYDRFDIIHAGSDLQSDLQQDSPEDIPTFTIGVAGDDAVVLPDSTNRPIELASVIPETIDQDGYYGALNGVMAHENGHNLFGFLDVYDVTTGLPVAGYWSLMDSGALLGAIVQLPDLSLFYVTGLLPPSVDPFNRQFITPAAAAEATPGDTLVLHAIERNDDIRRVTMAGDEYLLLENRFLSPSDSVALEQDTTRVILGPEQPDRLEYDALLPGGGVLIWHVDESVLSVPPYGINADSSRRGLTVLEADGLQDLGDPNSPYFLGAPTDPWFVGNATLLDGASAPPLRTNTGADPRLGVKVLDPRLSAMRVLVAHAPQVTVLFPNGGEGLVVGGDVMLVWNTSAASGIVSVKLEISRDQGSTWETIAASTPNTGGHVWHVTPPTTAPSAARFRVTAVDAGGFHGNDQSDRGFTIYAPTAVGEAGVDFALDGIGPNPATGAPVRIEYRVGREAAVRLSIIDVQGRVRAVLADGVARPGRYEALWKDGAEAPAGLYFVTYRAEGRTYTRRVVVTH